MFSKLTIKILEQLQSRCSGVLFVNFEKENTDWDTSKTSTNFPKYLQPSNLSSNF